MSGVSARDLGLLAAILLLALVLRLVGLNAPLWYDEILTIDTHLRLPWTGMLQSYSMNHHYFFDLQAKATMEVFGEAPWSVRLPALLFGLATIVAVWVLARDVATTSVAHVTALLLALSYHQIWFSQNARGYTELAFWSTLGLLFFLRGLRDPRPALWFGFGLTLAAATYTHLTGAFFFAALGLIWLLALLRGGGDRRLLWMPVLGAGFGVLVLLLAYAPLIPSLGQTVAAVGDTSAIDVMQEYQNPVWTALEAVRTGMGSGGVPVALVALLVLGLSVIGGFAAARQQPWFAPAVLLHIVLTIAVLMALGMRLWPRFFFADIGFLMLLIVLGVRSVCSFAAHLIGQDGWAQRAFAVAVIGMVLVSSAMAARNYSAPKQNLAGAVALIADIRQPGERVYAVGPAAAAFTGYFQTDWHTITDNAGYAAALAQPGPVLFVVAFPARVLRRVDQMQADRDRVLTELHWFPGTLGDGGVVLFRRP